MISLVPLIPYGYSGDLRAIRHPCRYESAVMKKHYFRDLFCLVIVFLPLYLLFSGSSRLWDWDETVYAAAAKQMFERGDWIVPIVTERADGSLFYGDKPILTYWGMIVSFHLFGVNEIAARFPSTFFGTLSLLLVYAITRRLFDRRVANGTAYALGTMILYAVESSSVTTDATLTFWTMSALLSYVCGVFPSREQPPSPDGVASDSVSQDSVSPAFFPQNYACCLLMYFCLGFAFLTKGPVGVVLPMAVIGMFMLVKRLKPLSREEGYQRYGEAVLLVRLFRPFHPVHFLKTLWAMRPVTALVAIGITAVPWYVAVHQATDGVWTQFFFGVHNFGRATAAMEGHAYPLDFYWYYPFSMLAITFPWSIFFVPALLDMIRQLRRGTPFENGYVLAACLVCVYIGVFGFIDTKMPNYVFIGSVGAAMVYAAFLANWADGRALVHPRWIDGALLVILLVALLLGLVLKLFLIPVAVPQGWPLLMIPAVLVYATVRLWCVLYKGKHRRFVRGMHLTAVILIISVLAFGARIVSRQQDYPLLFEQVRRECPEPVFCSFDQFEPSWVFYGGQRIVRYDIKTVEAFLKEHPVDGYIITCKEKYERFLRPVFGNRLRVALEFPYFLKLERVPEEAGSGSHGHIASLSAPDVSHHRPQHKRLSERQAVFEGADQTENGAGSGIKARQAFGFRQRTLVVLRPSLHGEPER